MVLNIKIVRVDSDYCDYLRNYDSKISYNMNEKELRPFVGVLFKVNSLEYFAPLSSPKTKHKSMYNTIDFFKIKNGDLGAINFNNMIPVGKGNYSLLDLNKAAITTSELKYQNLLKEQLQWLNQNYEQIKNKSYRLYNLFLKKRLPESVLNRCCNFTLLEEKSLEYNK